MIRCYGKVWLEYLIWWKRKGMWFNKVSQGKLFVKINKFFNDNGFNIRVVYFFLVNKGRQFQGVRVGDGGGQFLFFQNLVGRWFVIFNRRLLRLFEYGRFQQIEKERIWRFFYGRFFMGLVFFCIFVWLEISYMVFLIIREVGKCSFCVQEKRGYGF